jgi:hypothetical protein
MAGLGLITLSVVVCIINGQTYILIRTGNARVVPGPGGAQG